MTFNIFKLVGEKTNIGKSTVFSVKTPCEAIDIARNLKPVLDEKVIIEKIDEYSGKVIESWEVDIDGKVKIIKELSI